MGATHGVNGQTDITETTVQHIFLLMGQNLEQVEEAPAGTIVGIGGLENILLKTGTLSDDPNCPNFTKTKSISVGLVKVALETKNLSEMPYLLNGLRKLDKADPSVEFAIT